ERIRLRFSNGLRQDGRKKGCLPRCAQEDRPIVEEPCRTNRVREKGVGHGFRPESPVFEIRNYANDLEPSTMWPIGTRLVPRRELNMLSDGVMRIKEGAGERLINDNDRASRIYFVARKRTAT